MSKAIIERLKKTCHSIHRPRRPPELFKYEPLGRQESALRLITVLPDLSTEGRIQCSLYNASSRTHRSYSCLSYTWGSPRPKRAVLINGCIFYVQPNLSNFLNIARTMRTTVDYWPDHFWIDAICIDQSNTIERNRQVTRMGEIYDGANLVVVWLGHTENEQLLRQACDSLDPLSNNSQEVLYEDLANNEYWSRGWITQELVFANRIEFVYSSTTFDLETLLRIVHDFTAEEYCISAFSKFLHLGVDRKRVLGMSLVSLLQIFLDRKCGVPRDRIFSLRALCHEKNDIKVDYGCPVFEFIHSILGSCAETSCLCATMEIMESLTAELAVQDGFDLNCKTGPYIEFNMHAGMTSCMLLQILEDVLPDRFRVCKDTARLSLWDLWNLHQEMPIFRLCRKCDRPDLSILRGTRDCVQATGFVYGTLSF